MSNYALRLPESLKQAAKRIAASDDTTMNQFLWWLSPRRSAPWRLPSSSKSALHPPGRARRKADPARALRAVLRRRRPTILQSSS